MKNSTRSTSSQSQNECGGKASTTIPDTKPFYLTRNFLAMQDMRRMVIAFLPLFVPGIVLMFFSLETHSSYDTPLGFAAVFFCTLAFVPTFVVIGLLFCIFVDYVVLLVRILMEFMDFTGRKRS